MRQLILSIVSCKPQKRQLKQSKAKTSLKHFSRINGVDIKSYRADNHIYNSNLFRQSYTATGQGLTFSGVNAHYQNGVAKRKISYITNLARTMIFHAIIS